MHSKIPNILYSWQLNFTVNEHMVACTQTCKRLFQYIWNLLWCNCKHVILEGRAKIKNPLWVKTNYCNTYDKATSHAAARAAGEKRTMLAELFLKMNRAGTPTKRLQHRRLLVFRPNINPNITNCGCRPQPRPRSARLSSQSGKVAKNIAWLKKPTIIKSDHY